MVTIVTAGTPSHDDLRRDYFEKSLSKCEPVNWIHFQQPTGSNPKGDFGYGDWLTVMQWKIRCAIKSLKAAPKGLIVLSDLDIIYMPGAFHKLEEKVTQGIYCMRENAQGELNAGLIAGKDRVELLFLFESMLDHMDSNPGHHDQDALRAVAHDRARTLPFSFANTKTIDAIVPGEMLCYHAICTRADDQESSVEKKKKLLDKFIDGD